MPSLNRIQRLSVGVLAGAAIVAVPASTASANSVQIWACHGPDGQWIGAGGLTQSGDVSTYGGGCEANGGTGLLPQLAPTPAPGADSSVTLGPLTGVTWKSVAVTRATTGLNGAQNTGQSYVASRNGGAVLETADNADLPSGTPVFTYPDGDTDDFFKIGVHCTGACSASPSGQVGALINSIAATVDDSVAPAQAVGAYRSPAAGDLVLDIAATDAGLGLDRSVAYVEGGRYGRVQVADAGFGGSNCSDMTPSASTTSLRADEQCPPNGHASLTVHTTQFDDGDYTLIVDTYDIARNMTETKLDLNVWNHPPIGSPTQVLTIGTSSPTVLPGGGGPAGGAGGVAGASSSSCNSPKLSMFLAQKPLRVSHGVPVLKYGKRYRFNGRLTCVIKGKRQSAPKRTRIDLQNKVGKKTVTKNGTTVRTKGKITMILAYKSSRTLIFKFTNTNGKVSQVKIKIRVAHK